MNLRGRKKITARLFFNLSNIALPLGSMWIGLLFLMFTASLLLQFNYLLFYMLLRYLNMQSTQRLSTISIQSGD